MERGKKAIGGTMAKKAVSFFYRPDDRFLCKYGRVETAKKLLEAGADVTLANDEGVTTLHEAAHYGEGELVKMFIAAGGSINRVNDQGVVSPLPRLIPRTS